MVDESYSKHEYLKTHKNLIKFPLISSNFIYVTFGNVTRPVLVDTGATISMVSRALLCEINPKMLGQIRPGKLMSAKLVNGSKVDIVGEITLCITLRNENITFTFQVLPNMGYWAILGVDFLEKFDCLVDYDSQNFVIPLESQNGGGASPVIGALDSSNLEICDAPREPHDLQYYEKAAIPDFSKVRQAQEHSESLSQIMDNFLPPVPLDLSDSLFNDTQKQTLKEMIKEFRDVFAVTEAELGRTNLYQHKIRLKPGAQPPKPRLYRTSPREREFIKSQIEDMLAIGVIEPVLEGSFSSPILLVPKKDGGLRFCVDLRGMNKIIVEDTYPLPLIQDVLDAIGYARASIYSIIDLRSAFWQVAVHPSSTKYLTFITYMGRYAFQVLPFGLHSSPAAFQRLMNTILRGLLWEIAIPFLDDIVIFSPDPVSHLKHIRLVFERLQYAGLKLKPQKCSFGMKSIKYLGHRIGEYGISPFLEKVEAVKNYRPPTNVTQVRMFLGLANYYRKFIKDFSKLARPIINLTKKGQVFQWTEETQRSFNELKRRLLNAPILAHANPKLPYRLTTDASRIGLGWVLEQKQDGNFRVICYGGKSLTPAQKNYGISDLEALAVITAIKELDCYLRYQEFVIVTDHQPLKYMLTNPNPPPGRWSRWIALLTPYNFTVEYVNGSTNKVADTLSRQPYSETASEDDDLESYLCPIASDSNPNHRGVIIDHCYVNQDPECKLSAKQKTIMADFHKEIMEKALRESAVVNITQAKKQSFFRTKNWISYKSNQTSIKVSRQDPATISADCILNFTNFQQKPIGPVSKSIQLTGGPEYKKFLQKDMTKNGDLNMGNIREIRSGCNHVLWIYNINLPKQKLGKEVAQNVVYKTILKALRLAANSKLTTLIISPTDLLSLDYSARIAMEIVAQSVWDHCQNDKPAMVEILIPIQTLSMATRMGKLLQNLVDNPQLKIFEIKEAQPIRQIHGRLGKPENAISDTQKLIQDLKLSKGFEELDYDLDNDRVKELQLKDPYFGPLMNYLQDDTLPDEEKVAKKIRKGAQNYELIAGVLYNFWLVPKGSFIEKRARFRLCVPPEYRNQLMYAYHDTPISAHRSAEKMYVLMKLSYFWKGMFLDIQNWVQSCIRCSKAKSLPRNRRAKLQPIMEHSPLGMVNIDLIGPMQESPEQYRYVLTMVDRATRYCFAVPIKDGSAITIAKAIFSDLISKFGLVDCLVSDRGLNFISPVIQHLCKLLGTKRILTSAYRPQSNGLVESFNKIFKAKLLSLVGDNPELWPRYVDSVAYSLRNTVVDSTGYTPYELMFGREPKLLLTLGENALKSHPSKSVRRYLAELRTQLNYLWSEARATEEKQKQVMKDNYDKKSKPYEYQEGDRVWIHSPRLTLGSTRKFRDKYVGPYILCQRTSENNFKVRREGSNVISDISLHSDRFKPCVSRYVRPSYIPGIVDETEVGPDLPLELCTDSDFEDLDKTAVHKRNVDQDDQGTASKDNGLRVDPKKDERSGMAKNVEKLMTKLSKVLSGQENEIQKDTESHEEENVEELDDDKYYEVERIIRGKYTPEGIKYLIKWAHYSPKYNSWEKESDLSPETRDALKEKPVRIFGRKPAITLTKTTGNLDDEVSSEKAVKDMTLEELQEAYEADTIVDSDEEIRNISDVED